MLSPASSPRGRAFLVPLLLLLPAAAAAAAAAALVCLSRYHSSSPGAYALLRGHWEVAQDLHLRGLGPRARADARARAQTKRAREASANPDLPCLGLLLLLLGTRHPAVNCAR